MECKKCNRVLPEDSFSFCRGKRITTCKDCRNAYTRQWRKENTTWDQKAYHAEWRKRNRAKLNLVSKAWRDANPEKMRQFRSAWAANNPEKVGAIVARYWKKRLPQPEFKAKNRIKARIRDCIRGRGNGGGTFARLGYSRQELMTHLERQFLKGMSWENMGDWHIDHIVPLSSFTIMGPDDPELRRAWALPNLRPLWAKDNLQKHQKRTHLI